MQEDDATETSAWVIIITDCSLCRYIYTSVYVSCKGCSVSICNYLFDVG